MIYPLFLKAGYPKHILSRFMVLVWLFIIMVESMSCKEKKETETEPVARDEQHEIEEIKKMETDRLAAGVSKNLSFFDAATADDYIQIDFDGNVLDKKATLERVKSSYAQLRSNEFHDMVVRIYGNTAVVTAMGNPKGIMKGKEFSDSVRYTRIYVKRNDRWQVVSFQQTRIVADK